MAQLIRRVVRYHGDEADLASARRRLPTHQQNSCRLRARLDQTTFRLRYAEGWSLVHYLFSRNDGTVDLLLRGGSLRKPEEIEQGWKKHLKDMER